MKENKTKGNARIGKEKTRMRYKTYRSPTVPVPRKKNKTSGPCSVGLQVRRGSLIGLICPYPTQHKNPISDRIRVTHHVPLGYRVAFPRCFRRFFGVATGDVGAPLTPLSIHPF